jgi:hypothetical protein
MMLLLYDTYDCEYRGAKVQPLHRTFIRSLIVRARCADRQILTDDDDTGLLKVDVRVEPVRTNYEWCCSSGWQSRDCATRPWKTEMDIHDTVPSLSVNFIVNTYNEHRTRVWNRHNIFGIPKLSIVVEPEMYSAWRRRRKRTIRMYIYDNVYLLAWMSALWCHEMCEMQCQHVDSGAQAHQVITGQCN